MLSPEMTQKLVCRRNITQLCKTMRNQTTINETCKIKITLKSLLHLVLVKLIIFKLKTPYLI